MGQIQPGNRTYGEYQSWLNSPEGQKAAQAERAQVQARKDAGGPQWLSSDGMVQPPSGWSSGQQSPQGGFDAYKQSTPQGNYSAYSPSQARPQQQSFGTPYNPQQGGNFSAYRQQPTSTAQMPQWASQMPMGGQNFGMPAFQFRATDFMGNQFSDPNAFTAQQGAMVQALNQQRAGQIGNLFTQGQPMTPLNPQTAYNQGMQMLQGGFQNPFMDPSVLSPQPFDLRSGLTDLFGRGGMQIQPGVMDQILGLLNPQAPPQMYQPRGVDIDNEFLRQPQQPPPNIGGKDKDSSFYQPGPPQQPGGAQPVQDPYQQFVRNYQSGGDVGQMWNTRRSTGAGPPTEAFWSSLREFVESGRPLNAPFDPTRYPPERPPGAAQPIPPPSQGTRYNPSQPASPAPADPVLEALKKRDAAIAAAAARSQQIQKPQAGPRPLTQQEQDQKRLEDLYRAAGLVQDPNTRQWRGTGLPGRPTETPAQLQAFNAALAKTTQQLMGSRFRHDPSEGLSATEKEIARMEAWKMVKGMSKKDLAAMEKSHNLLNSAYPHKAQKEQDRLAKADIKSLEAQYKKLSNRPPTGSPELIRQRQSELYALDRQIREKKAAQKKK